MLKGTESGISSDPIHAKMTCQINNGTLTPLINNMENINLEILFILASDKALKGTIMNRALYSFHSGSLKIKLTLPLNVVFTILF